MNVRFQTTGDISPLARLNAIADADESTERRRRMRMLALSMPLMADAGEREDVHEEPRQRRLLREHAAGAAADIGHDGETRTETDT